MRCEHDTMTAELPGIPPAPVKPPKTTQAQRIERMGYQGPKDRPSCQHCHHCRIEFRNPDSIMEFEVIRCAVGDFPIMRGGICSEFSS